MKEIYTNADVSLPASGATRMMLSWMPGSPNLDVLCFAVGAGARVPGDAWLVFFNQPRSPDNAIQLGLQGQRAALSVEPKRLPDSVHRCLIMVVPEDDQGFGAVRDLTVDIQPPDSEPLRYRVPLPSRGKAQMVVELGRTVRGWRLRTVDQVFEVGLAELVIRHGVAVSDTPASPPAPAPAPPSPSRAAPPRPEPTPRPARGRRRPLRWLALLLFLGMIGGVGYYFYRPFALPDPGPWLARVQDWWPDSGPPPVVAAPPAIEDPGQCSLNAEAVMARYHELGNNYLKISEVIEDGDVLRSSLSRQLREMDLACPDPFEAANREQLETLAGLPIIGWFAETELLSLCVGALNDQIQARLERSNPVAVTRRLTAQADDYRRVESDLTNIARELAYYANKQERLSQAFQTHLDICAQFE